MIAEHKCEIETFSFSDEQLMKVGADTALITMKVTANGTCGGPKMPSPVISASLYVRMDREWKAGWHGEVAVVDPTSWRAPPKTAVRTVTDAKTANNKPVENKPASSSETDALQAVERSVWEAWMKRDGKTLDELTAKELSFVNIFGGYFANRSDTLKDWSDTKCEITSVGSSDASSISVTDDTSILFHIGGAEGTCFGQQVPPVFGTSIYVKDGGVWKVAFTMNMPAL